MSGAFSLSLPIPPGINGTGSSRGGYAIATVGGYPRLVLSARARAWRKDAVATVQKYALAARYTYQGGNLRMVVHRNDRHDVDSGIKLLIDSVCSAIGANDRRLVELVVDRDGDTFDAGFLEVWLEESVNV